MSDDLTGAKTFLGPERLHSGDSVCFHMPLTWIPSSASHRVPKSASTEPGVNPKQERNQSPSYKGPIPSAPICLSFPGLG